MGDKKLQSVEGYWTCVKELIEWTVDMEEGTVAHPDIKHQDFLELFNLPALQHHMVCKDLEKIIGKLHYIHLVVPGAVARIYHLQRTLTQCDEDRAFFC